MAKLWALATVFVVLCGGSLMAFAASPVDGYPELPYFGPNCWSFALIHSKAVSKYRSIGVSEFWHYMKSAACREVKNVEVKRGDIATLANGEYGLIHSWIVLDMERALEKASPYPESQIGFKDWTELRSVPHTTILYHRCDFSRLKKSSGSQADILLNQVEDETEKYVLNQKPKDSQHLKELLIQALELREFYAKMPLVEATFELRAQLLKAEGLTVQIFMLLPEDEQGRSVQLLEKVRAILSIDEARTAKIKEQFK